MQNNVSVEAVPRLPLTPPLCSPQAKQMGVWRHSESLVSLWQD